MSIPIDPTKLRFGSVCSGIEAASCAWNELGWRAAWFSEIEPFPCELLKQRFPDVPNFGDMTKLPERILSGEIEAPDILCGGTPCFVAGTMVLTQDGYKPIENIAVGDMVMTHKGRLRKVLRTGSKLAEVGTLRMVGHKGFTCTPNHPFLSALKKDGEPIDETAPFDWIDAKDLPGRQWCSPVRYEKTLCSFRSPKLTNLKDLLYFAGFYVGDGYIRGWTGRTKKAVVLCLNESKLSLFRERLPHLCGTVTANGNALKVTIYDTALANWLTENFGELSYQKRIPSWLYGSSCLSEFITGYLLTDGSTFGKHLSFGTTSKSLAYGICDLLNLCGFTASTKLVRVKPTTTIEGRTVNQRPLWQTRGFDNSRKSRYANGYLCRTVQSYVPSNSTSQVFNLEVEEDNSYIAEGAAVHNCQAFSLAGKRLSLDDARGNLSLVFCQIADAIDAVRAKLRYPPPISFSGKTFPESLTRKTTPSGVSWAHLLVQALPLSPMQDDGRVLVLLQDPKERSHGARLMLNTSECPNAVVESSLLQVLEKTSIPPKYFLSPTACLGILRRAEAKGKKLPELLYKTLQLQAKGADET